MTSDTAEREAFEKWWEEDGTYQDEYDLAWITWQARAALPARAPEGWVLVPRAPTQEMLDAACADGTDHPVLKHTKPEERGGAIPLLPVAFYRAMLSASPPPPEQKEERDDAKVYADFVHEVNAAPVRYDFQVPKIGSEGQPYREPHASPAPGPAEDFSERGEFLEYEDLSRAQPGPAEPVVRALELVDTIAAIIDERAFNSAARWHNGNTRSRRRNNARVRAKRILSALQPPHPAPQCPACLGNGYEQEWMGDDQGAGLTDCAHCGGSGQAPQPAPAPMAAQPQTSAEPLPFTFLYRNYRGEVSERNVEPLGVWFGRTGWHPEAQWFLNAVDLDKCARRDFALRDINPPPPASDERVAAMREKCARVLASHIEGRQAVRADPDEVMAQTAALNALSMALEAIRALPLDGEG